MTDLPFPYCEVQLAAGAGVALRGFQKIREKKMREGDHWKLTGGRVMYSESGFSTVMLILKMALIREGVLLPVDGVDLDLLKKNARLEPAPELPVPIVLTGRVERFFMNRHLLGVRLADKRLVNVLVNKRKNFRIGMEVPIRPGATESTWLLDRKEPRFPGRW